MSGNAQRNNGIVALAATVLMAVIAAAVGSKVSWGGCYIHDNLEAQNIVFPPILRSDGSVNGEVAGSVGLSKFAGEQLTSGSQAQCYADDFIGRHMTQAAQKTILTSKRAIIMNGGEASLEGATYATLGKFVYGLDPSGTTDDSERQAREVDAAMVAELQDSFYKGEMLRGTLLNAYGWSVVVDIGDSTVKTLRGLAGLTAGAGVLLLVRSRRIAG